MFRGSRKYIIFQAWELVRLWLSLVRLCFLSRPQHFVPHRPMRSTSACCSLRRKRRQQWPWETASSSSLPWRPLGSMTPGMQLPPLGRGTQVPWDSEICWGHLCTLKPFVFGRVTVLHGWPYNTGFSVWIVFSRLGKPSPSFGRWLRDLPALKQSCWVQERMLWDCLHAWEPRRHWPPASPLSGGFSFQVLS